MRHPGNLPAAPALQCPFRRRAHNTLYFRRLQPPFLEQVQHRPQHRRRFCRIHLRLMQKSGLDLENPFSGHRKLFPSRPYGTFRQMAQRI